MAAFVLLAGATVWWVAHHWPRLAVGRTAPAARAAVRSPSPERAAAVAAAAAADGVPALPQVTADRAPAAAATSPARGAGGGAQTTPAGTAAGSGTTSYFAAARLERAQAESRELAQLQSLADDPSASPAVRGQAQEEILQLDAMEREQTQAEMVLEAKGFPQAIVFLAANGAVVVVQARHFDAAAAAAVAQAVAQVATIQPDQIQIVAKR
jgi:stage III sporulation protein AH